MDTFQVAAKWWADQLRGPTTFENGGTEPVHTIAKSMVTELHDLNRPPDEKIDQFERTLTIELRLEATRVPQYFRDWGIRFGVDYHPDRFLAEVCKAADIDTGLELFPWKTTMTVMPHKVEVSQGYGQPFETIFEQEREHGNDNGEATSTAVGAGSAGSGTD